MVKITNGIDVFEVSRGAYEGIYAHQGYKILIDEKPEEVMEDNEPAKSEDEKFFEEIVEKPLSQWNKTEVKRFAALKEIDIAGTKNVNEAKTIIKEFLEVEGVNGESVE